ERVGTARAGEVVEAETQYNGAPHSSCSPHPAGDAVDEPDERCVEIVQRGRRAAERALRADGAPAAVRPHRPRVAVVSEGVKVAARRAAEQGDERVLTEPRDLADRPDPAA